jgi:hypothetical protein
MKCRIIAFFCSLLAHAPNRAKATASRLPRRRPRLPSMSTAHGSRAGRTLPTRHRKESMRSCGSVRVNGRLGAWSNASSMNEKMMEGKKNNTVRTPSLESRGAQFAAHPYGTRCQAALPLPACFTFAELYGGQLICLVQQWTKLREYIECWFLYTIQDIHP